MLEGGFNQKSLARFAGLNETAVRDILKGRSKNPRLDTLEALARALDCTVVQLAGGRSVPRPDAKTDCIDVIGAVEAGVGNKSLVRPVDDWYELELPRDRRYRDRPRFALEVRGNAAERFYKRGDVVVCVKPEELNRVVADGDKLVIQLERDDSEFEFVIGQHQTDDDGDVWYWIASSDGGRMSRADTPGIKVVAVVVASYRQE
jgi:transcriptional regulator with XRE-family HTH domain